VCSMWRDVLNRSEQSGILMCFGCLCCVAVTDDCMRGVWGYVYVNGCLGMRSVWVWLRCAKRSDRVAFQGFQQLWV